MKKNLLQQAGVVLITALALTACSKKKDNPNPDDGGGGSVTVEQISFSELKKLSTGASVNIPDGKKITGTVISDASGKNIEANTVVLEDANNGAGLMVNFASAPTAAVGDQVEIDISKQTLAQVNGEIVVQGVAASNLKKTGTGTITAKATTAAEITKNAQAWDGTLVSLPAGSFSGGNGNYTGTLSYNDGNGSISSTILSGATFAGTAYPVAVDGITGIVRINGSTVRVDIRNTTDVTADVNIARVITEDFSTTTSTIEWKGGFALANGNASMTTTPLGMSYIRGDIGLMTPMAGDEKFLSASSKYLYLWEGNSSSYVEPVASAAKWTQTNLKQIKMEIAASAFTGNVVDNAYAQPLTLKVDPFDSTQPDVVSLALFSGSSTSFVTVAKFNLNDVGVLHTVTFNIPSTQADWEAALIAAGNDQSVVSTQAQNIMTTLSGTGTFAIKVANSSVVSGGSAELTTKRKPVIIKQLQLGYSQ